jgi:biopolymer transport protein ExbD
MALARRKKQSQKFVPPKLMLTSMMDMFTIILIFLLFSFSANPEHMKLDKDLELPHSTAEQGYQKTIKIVLSQKELRLNDEVMAEVQNDQIVGLAPEDLKSSTLYQRLKAKRAEQTLAAKPGETREAPNILFLCDKSHSFRTINEVIKTAGMAGYPNFQFAVLEEKK